KYPAGRLGWKEVSAVDSALARCVLSSLPRLRARAPARLAASEAAARRDCTRYTTPMSTAMPMAGNSTRITMAPAVSSTKPRRPRRFPGRAAAGSKQEANIVSSARIGQVEKVEIGHGEIPLHHGGRLPGGERQHGIEAGGDQ